MRVQRFIRIASLLLIFSLSIMIGQAQQVNLLSNPGFEDGFRSVSGFQNPQVANSWELWTLNDPNAPSFFSAPLYFPASAASARQIVPRVRNGSNAQVYHSYFSTHDAGLYQRVTGITSGAELRFSIYAHVFSSSLADFNLSEQPGGVALRVGIDPTGGTDPLSSNVVYSETTIFYDAYREYSVIAKAQGTAVTVFVRTTVSEPVQNSVVYLDDAVLNVTPESQPVSTATNTARPTNTTAPTNTARPTNTTVAATNTSRPTNTTVPPTNTAVSGDATPTREVSNATNTTAPTNTVTVSTATTAATNTRIAPTAVAGFPGSINHTVRRGDTVGGIAARYGSAIDAIIEVNELDEDAFIQVGQILVVPIRVVPATETPSPTPLVTNTPTPQSSGGTGTGTVYVVQRGDTLSTLAIRFNTTVATLVQLNGITNPNSIFVGQRLTLPSGQAPVIPTATPLPAATATSASSGGVLPTQPSTNPNSGQNYVVQPNDTLYRIAIRFNVSILTLANINGITNYNYIQIGQVLRIP